MIIDGFSGPGGWCEGARMLGLPDVVGIELDAAACATRAAAGHRTIRADVAQFDVSRLAGRVTGMTHSAPCFPAGTPVLTARGMVPIETVRIGDRVLTHQNRWRPVVATMNRSAEVWADRWLAATADHPFWSREQVHYYAYRQRAWKLAEQPQWTPASEIAGQYLAIPEKAERLHVPAIKKFTGETDEAFWWAIGRWLGDGWLRIRESERPGRSQRRPVASRPRRCAMCPQAARAHARLANRWTMYCGPDCAKEAIRLRQRRSEVLICCGRHEARDLEKHLGETGLRWTRSEESTTTRFTLPHVGLAKWLATHFGRGAARKTLPGWALTLPIRKRQALLEGYLSADGSETSAGWCSASVSTCLTFGVRLLATSLGYTTSLNLRRPATGGMVDGRRIATSPIWSLNIKRDDGRYSVSDGSHRWVKWRRPLERQATKTVYDLTVAEDHSFVAYGFVVHNCITFSAAGKRAGVALTEILARGVSEACAGAPTRAARRRDMTRALRDAGFSSEPKASRSASYSAFTRFATWEDEDGRIHAVRDADGNLKRYRQVISSPSPGEQRRKAVLSASLVIEPARYIRAAMPEWVALEQVPSVLPLWQVYARELRRLGYSVWCGVVNSADYGVPQTRQRAVLIASRKRRVGRPAATHYDARKGLQLFGTPWVSMAEALGWGATARPVPTVTAGGTRTGGAEPFGHRDRDALEAERDAGEWVLRRERSAIRAEHDMARDRPLTVPAPTVSGGGEGRMSWVLHTNRDQRPDGSRQTVDPSTAPAPAPALTAKSGGQWALRMDTQAKATLPRPADEPAPTIQFAHRANLAAWVRERPSTTVMGDPRIGRPGHKGREAGGEPHFAVDSVRISVAEAAVLQSFPADYPWRGTKTAQFTQVGNAVPPRLAMHILAEATGLPIPESIPASEFPEAAAS